MKQSALLTDLYQLTMLQGYLLSNRIHQRAAFELFCRSIPESGGYLVASGIEQAIEQLCDFRFTTDDIAYLQSLNLFVPEFLDYLKQFRFRGNVVGLLEGTVFFPHEPILEVEAELGEAQLVETFLLNAINFPTLVASKASRMVEAAAGRSVVDMGLRRAQGPNGGLTASRSAMVGGFSATSNVLAGKEFGVPVIGTQAHSWIMCFPTELDAFRTYAQCYPDQTTLLIDTYDTLRSGLVNAVIVGMELERKGHRLNGIRLDSGNIAELAVECRRQLNSANLNYVKIIVSNDLDEYKINDLVKNHVPIDVFGIGTRIATAFQEPALGGVYKLVALKSGDLWDPKLKLSSTLAKSTWPARKSLWRMIEQGKFVGDVIAGLGEPTPKAETYLSSAPSQLSATKDGNILSSASAAEPSAPSLADLMQSSASPTSTGDKLPNPAKAFKSVDEVRDFLLARMNESDTKPAVATSLPFAIALHAPLIRNGERVHKSESVGIAAARRAVDVQSLPPALRQLKPTETYPIHFSEVLKSVRQQTLKRLPKE